MKDERLESGAQGSAEAKARRNFLKKSGRVAVAAPAVALLLAAQSKNAMAIPVPYEQPPG